MEYFKNLFNTLKEKDYFKELNSFLDKEYSKYTIYPKKEEIFKAFSFFNEKDLKVVIIGQDPYPNKGQANGLAFSVNKGIKLPPSLINIYKEIEIEFNCVMDFNNGDLTYLAKQGVLLLNPILTVKEKEPLSHKNKLYDNLFKDIMKYLDSLDQNIVFLLWGNNAKKYDKLITNKKRLVIKTNHPSPLSANRGGWFNSNCFYNTNKYLENNNIKPIYWVNNINIFC